MRLPLSAGFVLVLDMLSGSQAPALSDILSQAGQYVEQFKREFKVVISDERYEQRLRRTEDRDQKLIRSGARRDIQSETLFVSLPAERTWLTLRRIRRVDGKPVADSGQRLETILADTGPARSGRLRQLLDESSRFNLGQIARNFSDPTLVLQFLQPSVQARFDFTFAGSRRRKAAKHGGSNSSSETPQRS